MPANMLRRADRSILPSQRPVAPHHAQRRARGGLCISTLKEEHRIYPWRRSPQGPQGLCTSSNLMCRLARTMGEVSNPVCSRSSSSSWVPNCAFRHATPMWITWRQGSVPVATGERKCCWYSFMPRIFGQLWFTCGQAPLLVSTTKDWRAGLCYSFRELALTFHNAPGLSLCKFHFKLFGALTVIPTLHLAWISSSVTVAARHEFQCSLPRGPHIGKKSNKYADLFSLFQTKVALHSPAPKLLCIHQHGKIQRFRNGHGARTWVTLGTRQSYRCVWQWLSSMASALISLCFVQVWQCEAPNQ